MSDDVDTNRDVRLMRELIDELRAEPVPAVDWPAVERRLTQHIAPMAARRRLWRSEGTSLEALRRASGFAAAAAAVAFMIAANGPNEAALGARAGQPRAGGLESGAAEARASTGSPKAGDTVQTAQTSRLVQVEGVGSWSLGPNSRALVRRTGEPYVVSLEQGSIDASVIPVADERGVVESFAVEVGQTRVAVHGTVFSVTRVGDMVQVEVLAGTVAIGPTGHRGLTIGRLLVAPARAEFSLDGGLQARMLPARQPGGVVATGRSGSADPTDLGLGGDESAPAGEGSRGRSRTTLAGRQGQPEAPRPGPEAGDSSEPKPPLDAEPTPGTPPPPATVAALSAADAQATIARCLAALEEGVGGSGVRVTISTQVTLHRSADDKIGSIQFSPPLRPDLQQRCASPLLGRQLSGTERTVRFPVVVAPR